MPVPTVQLEFCETSSLPTSSTHARGLIFVDLPLIISDLPPVMSLRVHCHLNILSSGFEMPRFSRSSLIAHHNGGELWSKLVAIQRDSSMSSTSDCYSARPLLPDTNTSQRNLRSHGGVGCSGLAIGSWSTMCLRPCHLQLLAF